MIYSIQALRGLAALAVVLIHVQPQLSHNGGPVLPWLNLGAGGVDLFFVISGFIIWSTSRFGDLGPAAFLQRRVVRLVPLYWLLTAFVSFVAVMAPSLLASTTFDLPHVVASFLFVPYLRPVLHYTSPILVPGWSLNYEMFFYLLFAVGLSLRNRMATFCVVVGTLSALVAFGLLLHPSGVQTRVYSDPTMLEFGLGLAIGLLYTDLPPPRLGLALLAISLGTSLLFGLGAAGFSDKANRLLLSGLPSALVVWGAVMAKRHGRDLARGPIVALGHASYSLYLSQVIALPLGGKLWHLAGLGFDGWRLPVFIVCEAAMAIGMGFAVFHALERPMLSVLRKRFEGQQPRHAPVVQGVGA